MGVTVKDVAAEAQVSISAVSRYLNGGPVGRDKKERIRAALDKTGYLPGKPLRSGKRSRRETIGVILPTIESLSAARVIKGISQVLDREGYTLILGNSDNRQGRDLLYLDQMARDQVAGVILLGVHYTREHERAFREYPVPLVVTGQNYPGVSCVHHDDFGAAKELTSLMLSKGRSRIGYIGVSKLDFAVGADRMRGVEYALGEKGRLCKERIVTDCDFSIEGGRELARELLEREKIDGLICATDMIAIGAMLALREKGLLVPEDVMVAGFGDSWAGQIMEPQLSSVRLYQRDAGIRAAEMLLEMVRGEGPMPPRTVSLGYEIFERGSTASVGEETPLKERT